jgi:methionyl-tRNA formyltransferase
MSQERKKLGVLVIARDYFVPYVQWLHEQDGKLFDLVGCVCNDDVEYTRSVSGYKRYANEDIFKECDLVLSLGYWKIIPGDVIESVPLGILNLHHSHRLKYRGRHTCSWALINNEKTHGSTLHYMSPKLDDGPILVSDSVQIEPDDTAEKLFKKVNDLGLQLVKTNLSRALERSLYDELPWPSGSYFTHRERDLSWEIPRDISDVEFERRVRALTFRGKPRPYVMSNGRKIFQVIDVDSFD